MSVFPHHSAPISKTSMAPYIAPEWLEVEKEMGGRPLLSGSFEIYQKNATMIENYVTANKPPHAHDGLKIDDVKINDNVLVRIYKPVSDGDLLPVGVFSHPGGFCSGSINAEDTFCCMIASKYPCIVVSVDYRKAPTVGIETVFQDVFDAFAWTYDNASTVGGNQKAVFIFGSSAGGTLSLATAHKLIETGRQGQLKGVINLAGGTVHPNQVPKHLQHLYRSMEENAVGAPIIDKEATMIINKVTGLDDAAQNPWIFPLLSKHLAGFPPTYLVACGADPLRDDCTLFARELESKQVKVRLRTYEGLPHLFWFASKLRSTTQFHTDLMEGIHFVLE